MDPGTGYTLRRNIASIIKIFLLLQSVSPTYIRDIQRYVMPFVKTCGEKNLFQTYLLETARQDLSLCFVVFKHMLGHVSFWTMFTCFSVALYSLKAKFLSMTIKV